VAVTDILQKVNWVDILALILLIRITYISSHVGVGKQILPLALLIIILSISLYNYKIIAGFFIDRYAFQASISMFLSYFFIALFFFVIYYLISRFMGLCFLPGEIIPGGVEKIGGIILGLTRSFFILGILLIGLLLTPIKFVENSVKNSHLAIFCVRGNVKIYSIVANMVFKKNNKTTSEEELSQLLENKSKYFFKGQ